MAYIYLAVVSVAKFFVVHIWLAGTAIPKSMICVRKKGKQSQVIRTNVPYMEETTTFNKLTILIQPIDIITIFNTLDTV